jgi:hypothetical protein
LKPSQNDLARIDEVGKPLKRRVEMKEQSKLKITHYNKKEKRNGTINGQPQHTQANKMQGTRGAQVAGEDGEDGGEEEEKRSKLE